MRRADGLALVAMACWGLAYAPSALLVERWPALVAAGARLGLAGAVLLGVLTACGRSLRPGTGAPAVLWLAATQSVAFYGATYSIWRSPPTGRRLRRCCPTPTSCSWPYLALARAPAARVSAWFFLVPIVGVAGAWPVTGEAPGPALLVGLAAVSAALWLVLGRPAPAGGGW